MRILNSSVLLQHRVLQGTGWERERQVGARIQKALNPVQSWICSYWSYTLRRLSG